MYVGFALWFLGYPLFQRSVSGALLAVIGIAQLLIWARVEERHMLARFGSEYTLYRSQTWF
jgi:protein-S-isoprenylcysteine O-methyltransferase Ste14